MVGRKKNQNNKKNLSIVFSYWEAEQNENSVCLKNCPWQQHSLMLVPAHGWSSGVTLLPAPHWPILHPLFPWEVKYGFCLLVTFSPVGSRVGLSMWLMPWKTLAGLVSSRRTALAPTPTPILTALFWFRCGVSPSSQLSMAQMVSRHDYFLSRFKIWRCLPVFLSLLSC